MRLNKKTVFIWESQGASPLSLDNTYHGCLSISPDVEVVDISRGVHLTAEAKIQVLANGVANLQMHPIERLYSTAL